VIVRTAGRDHPGVPREFDHEGPNPGAGAAVVRFDTGKSPFAQRRHDARHGGLNRRRIDLVDVVDQGVRDRKDGAGAIGGLDELLDRHARLGDVGRAVGAEPVDEHPVPGLVVLFADQFRVQVDHGPREMRATDGVDVPGHFGQIGQREVLKALLLEQCHQGVIAAVAVVAQRGQFLLEWVFGVQRQEVGEHVDVARLGDAVAHPRELCVAQGDLDPGHQFQSEPRARRGHLVVTQRRVVVGQGDRRYTQIVCLFGQLGRRVRSVGER